MANAKKLNGSSGVQISIRIPKTALEKLERLADKAVQTKAQWITKKVLDAAE
jgi:predicted DNA-binding protein